MEPSRLREHLADLHAEAEVLESRLSGIRKLLEGYAEVYPDLVTEVSTRPLQDAPGPTPKDDAPGAVVVPKGQDAVRRVLYESSGEWFTVTRMATELRRRGWIGDDPDAGGAVRAALARVAKSDASIFKDKGTKTGAITYSYRPFEHDRPEEDQTDSGPTLRDALWKALEDGSQLTVQDARRRAEQLGWRTASQHPHTRVRNTFRQLLQEGIVEREGDLYFRRDVQPVDGMTLSLGPTSPQHDGRQTSSDAEFRNKGNPADMVAARSDFARLRSGGEGEPALQGLEFAKPTETT